MRLFIEAKMIICTKNVSAVSLDYNPPTDTYVIEAGENSDCLQLMILDDSIFEGSEELTGSLEGTVNQLGQLVRNPDRITFDPTTTTIQINDNDGMIYRDNS